LGQKLFTWPYYSQRTVFAFPLERFFSVIAAKFQIYVWQLELLPVIRGLQKYDNSLHDQLDA